MLTLSKIFLHNWHRFHHHLLDVTDSLYLAGHNGSGKSSVLDALQVVLVADLTRARFNSSAQERSSRSLDSYVRGKIGEDRYLRPGNTVAYIALEFQHSERDQALVLGTCIESGESKSDRTFFIIPDALDPALFVPDGRPLPRRDLKQRLKSKRGARSYEQVGEYQTEMLNRLGGLNERFFDLFLRALTFQPIRDIRQFVEQWLLEERPLEVSTLQHVVEKLTHLRQSAAEVETRVEALQAIVGHQEEVRRLRTLHRHYRLLAAFLREQLARQQVADLAEEQARRQQQLAQQQQDRATTEAILHRTQESYIQAKVRLDQSAVKQREQELDEAIHRATREADAVRDRWQRLFRPLAQERTFLELLLEAAPLEAEEVASLRALVEALAPLDPTQPPDSALGAAFDAALPRLDAAHKRAHRAVVLLEEEQRRLLVERQAAAKELERLRAGGKSSYPTNVERLRDLLTPLIGERPPLLCELLSIPDERWQDAVEAMLAGRRFNVIVPPTHFAQALRRLDEARAQQRLYDVALLDLAKVQQEGRPARPGSLAQQVRARTKPLQAYIDSILGDIITCATVDELRHHRRAVTAEVVLYSEWSVRALDPTRFRPWFIGERAQHSQIESLTAQLHALDERLATLTPQVERARQEARALDRGRDWVTLRQQLEGELDEHPLRLELAELEAERAALDRSGVAQLEAEVERLQAATREEERRLRALDQQIARGQADQERLEERARAARLAEQEAAQAAHALRARYPDDIRQAEVLLAERQEREDLAEAARHAESRGRGYETQAENSLRALIGLGMAYNTQYQFSALPDNPDEARYGNDLARLEATELPRFRQQIQEEQQRAEEELREHVLYRLSEQILSAKEQLGRLNDALHGLDFHGDRYSFRHDPHDELRPYYDLLLDARLLGTGSLFDSDLYRQHQATFERFYEELTRTPQSEREREWQARLTDYRSYLTYDIEVTRPDGQRSRLSRIMGQTSGGETQTPFYLAIAASFVQLYHIREHSQHATIRLVAFDEAFSKMDQDRIGSTLDLFQSFNLQIITATPLERCEYLVPKICTTLVLTGVRDTVLVEPYQNYQVRLDAARALPH